MSKTIDQGIEDIERIIGSFFDRRDLLRKIGILLRNSTRLRFDTEKDPDGNRWTPSLRARREGNKTLTDEGNLRRSLQVSSDNNEVNVGTDIDYAKMHQLGLGDNPERAFLGLSRDDRDKILDLIQEELERNIK